MSVATPQVLGGRPGRFAADARKGDSRSAAVWWLVALALLAGGLIVATIQGLEATALGLMVAGAVLATVMVQPAIGILMLMANFLVASYPSPIRGDGLLTINNILGIIL